MQHILKKKHFLNLAKIHLGKSKLLVIACGVSAIRLGALIIGTGPNCHPDAGAYWEQKCDAHTQSVGFYAKWQGMAAMLL